MKKCTEENDDGMFIEKKKYTTEQSPIVLKNKTICFFIPQSGSSYMNTY